MNSYRNSIIIIDNYSIFKKNIEQRLDIIECIISTGIRDFKRFRNEINKRMDVIEHIIKKKNFKIKMIVTLCEDIEKDISEVKIKQYTKKEKEMVFILFNDIKEIIKEYKTQNEKLSEMEMGEIDKNKYHQLYDHPIYEFYNTYYISDPNSKNVIGIRTITNKFSEWFGQQGYKIKMACPRPQEVTKYFDKIHERIQGHDGGWIGIKEKQTDDNEGYKDTTNLNPYNALTNPNPYNIKLSNVLNKNF